MEKKNIDRQSWFKSFSTFVDLVGLNRNNAVTLNCTKLYIIIQHNKLIAVDQ